jgi:hypothetical protein
MMPETTSKPHPRCLQPPRTSSRHITGLVPMKRQPKQRQKPPGEPPRHLLAHVDDHQDDCAVEMGQQGDDEGIR